MSTKTKDQTRFDGTWGEGEVIGMPRPDPRTLERTTKKIARARAQQYYRGHFIPTRLRVETREE